VSIDETKADSVFSGISTFGRLPYYPCLASDEVKYDIAFIGTYPDYLSSIRTLQGAPTNAELVGAPFDTGTSYRPGARFGPSGIRQGSRRLNL
jgi:agmatinase